MSREMKGLNPTEFPWVRTIAHLELQADDRFFTSKFQFSEQANKVLLYVINFFCRPITRGQ
jgi:hypothetical protein